MKRIGRRGLVLTLMATTTVVMGLMFAVAAGPPDDAGAVQVESVRGKPVNVNGQDLKLWIFVHPARGAKPPGTPGGGPGGGGDGDDEDPSPYCDDGNQTGTVPAFANASSLTININPGSIPINQAAAIGAIRDSFGAWDAVSGTATDYFTVNSTGGASGPAFDGNNTVGWVKIVPRSVLAATWT